MHEEQDPKFSQRAAAVINSRFWFYGEPEPDDPAQARKWNERRWEMRNTVQAASHKARRYEDLSGQARELFDAAEAFDKQHSSGG